MMMITTTTTMMMKRRGGVLYRISYRNYSTGQKSSHYAVLGIAVDSTSRQIKRRFYELSKKYHPDKTRCLDEDEKQLHTRKFQIIKEAYDVLSNSKLKSQYDNSLGVDKKSFTPYEKTRLYRRSGKVHNYGKSFLHAHYDPLNRPHQNGSNYDVPHFDFDKHFQQQESYERHKRQRDQEKQDQLRKYQEKEFGYFRDEQFRRGRKWNLFTLGGMSLAVVGAAIYFK
jgi:curved DNA-binding protein CbpA